MRGVISPRLRIRTRRERWRHPSSTLQYAIHDGRGLDIEELHGCMPVDDLAEAKTWLKTRESEGYEFTKCVVVNMEGHVIWLRGNPGEWNWEGNC